MRALKNGILRLLGFFLKKRRKKPPLSPSFLLVSTTGLGDSIWASPLISALKSAYPRAPIDLLTSSIGEEVYRHHPNIRSILFFKKHLFWKAFSLRKKLIENRYQYAIFFHTSQRLIPFLVYTANIPHRIGTKGYQKGLDDLLTKTYPDAEHEIDRRKNLLAPLIEKIPPLSLEFFYTKKEEAFGENWLKSKRFGKLLLFHPGAKDFYKCWPIENWILLAKALSDQIEHTLFFSLGKEEEFLKPLIQKALPKALFIEKVSLREYASILLHFDLIVSNDTGPMHLACSLQKPVVAIFSATDPKRCGPYHYKKAWVIEEPRSCNPCLKRSCRLPFCMRQIGVNRVRKTVLETFTKI